ncbi:hypothetical protein B0H13DRAFT_2007003 [Mycena leptocephala]|nr:hypothetical protein B0H13DRAFT_2007003 [Mycena leptocephala]
MSVNELKRTGIPVYNINALTPHTAYTEISARWEVIAVENKPTWVLPSPFKLYNPGRDEWGPRPKTLFELAMYELSWAIRSKPEWQRKAADPEIRERWRREALEQAAAASASQENSEDVHVCLTDKMIDYVLAELDGYAKIADNERGIERGCFEAIWYSDRLISDDLLELLKTAASVLENVPDAQKDWHPGSNKQVLDLVHPSLYCVMYGRTYAYLPGKPRVAANFLPVHAPEESGWTSQDFCWMPSDFTVDVNGAVTLASPYINNLHPRLHRPLYRVIEKVLTAFIPMFERVLGDSNRENDRVPFSAVMIEEISCIWGIEILASIPKTLPEAKDYTGQLDAGFMPVSLHGRTVQCIIKLANIHLTPAQPVYEGGSWHVEGMVNESIVASGIYPIYHGRMTVRTTANFLKISDCMRLLYNMDRDSECLQTLVRWYQSGRALSWPNLFQHCVSPFELVDPSKPGHRKILAIFLLDPTKDPVVSTTDVPPQQAEWAAAAFEEACTARQLRDLIKDHFPTTVMTFNEAEAYRLTLMKERTAFVKDHTGTVYGQTFNMCEH